MPASLLSTFMRDHVGNRFGSAKWAVLANVPPTLASLPLLAWRGGPKEIQVMPVACSAGFRSPTPRLHLNPNNAGARLFAKG